MEDSKQENRTFRKGLILTGVPNCGKTVLAKNIAQTYPQEQVIEFNGRDGRYFSDTFTFMGLKKHHKLMIIDDLIKVDQLVSLSAVVWNDIKVHNQMEWPFIMRAPELIITTSIPIEKIKKLGRSFLRRFEVIEVKSCSYSLVEAEKMQIDFDQSGQPTED